jgi:hypothetical protein
VEQRRAASNKEAHGHRGAAVPIIEEFRGLSSSSCRRGAPSYGRMRAMAHAESAGSSPMHAPRACAACSRLRKVVSDLHSWHSWPRTVDDVVDRAVRILHDRALTLHCASATTGWSATSTRPGGTGGLRGGVGGRLFPLLQHILRHFKASLPLDVARQVLCGVTHRVLAIAG